MERPILNLGQHRMGQLDGLIASSHAVHMDLNSVLDWSRGVDKSLPAKRLECSCIYGTRHWDVLTDAQRIEMLWQEVALSASQFIWLEEALNPLFMRLLHRNHLRVPPAIREYMVIFCREEIVHTQMFRRYLKLAGLPVYGAPDIQYFFEELVTMHPVVGVLCVYLGEALAEEAVMRQLGPGIDPLTRQLFYEHHREEARHLAFGRTICEAFFEHAPVRAKERIGQLVRGMMSSLVPDYTYGPEIARHLSFDIGIDPDDKEEIRRVQLSPNNRRLTDETWGHLLRWLKRMGLAAPDYDWFDPPPPRPEAFAR
jgi:para-aminobenzoate N-oxygenase AurF